MLRWIADRWQRLTRPKSAAILNGDAPSASSPANQTRADSPISTDDAPLLLQPRRVSLALALLAVLLAVMAQIVFFNQLRDLASGGFFYLLAALSFIAAIKISEIERTIALPFPRWLRPTALGISRAPISSLLIIVSWMLTVVLTQMIRQPGHENYWPEFFVWLVSMIAFAAAFVRVPRSILSDLRAYVRANAVELSLVLVFTVVAGFLRFVALGDIPDVLSGDEGTIGLLAVAVTRGEIRNMFMTMYGHSTLYIFLMAWALKAFGVSAMGLRVTSAVAGTLAIPALYVIARYMFGKRVAFLATTLLIVAHIHIHFSRVIVAGSIQDVLFSCIVFYFFLSGLEKRSATRLMLSGLVLGVFLHIYMGSRLIVIFVPVYLAFLLIVDRKLVWDNKATLLAFGGGLVAAGTPMGTWAWLHPDEFMVRANQVGVFQSGWLVNEVKITGQSEIQLLLQLLMQAFLTVTYYQASGFYGADIPMLDFLSGVAFMLGLAYSLVKVWNARHLLLQGWFWSAVVVGGALAVLPTNAAYRILLALPAACIFVALGWDQLLKLIEGMYKDSHYVPWVAAALIVGATAFINVRYYFVDYSSKCLYEDWGTRYASTMGKYMAESGKDYMTYLVGAPRIYYGIHNSVDFLTDKMKVQDVVEPITDPSSLGLAGKTLFFFIPEREAEFEKVKTYFPGGEVTRFSDCNETIMIVYRVDLRKAP